MVRWGVSDKTPKDPTWIIVTKVNETKVRFMAIITKRVIMSRLGPTTTTIITTKTTITTQIIELDLMLPLKKETAPRNVGCNLARIEDIMKKMIRRFNATDENV